MADTRTKNTKSYDFHYVPDEGVLRGTIFEQQTEDAINDLGARTYEASDTATEALTEATTANKTANEALAIGNAAKTAADNAQAAADAAQADADAAQSTADTALALAKSNGTTIVDNTQTINTLVNQVADNTATIEEIITVNTQQTTDITALENRVTVTENNISVNAENINAIKDYQDPDGVTDANDLQTTANYELSGAANLPGAGTYQIEVRVNQAGDSNEVIQTATNKETGTTYIRYGEIADSEDESAEGTTTWGEWLSPEKDLQDLTATHTKEISTLQTDLIAHEADTNNPHKVTAEQLGLASAYRYIGSVASYSALPTSGLKNGDVYNVETGDESKGIPDGANVAWNGSGWDLIGGDLTQIMTDIDTLQATVETKADKEELENYLPLAGGTLTGALITEQGITLKNSGFELDAGTSSYDVGYNWASGAGPGAYFRGASYSESDEQGDFGFYARKDTSKQTLFMGKVNGTLTWDGKNIVRSINDTTADYKGNVVIDIPDITDLTATVEALSETIQNIAGDDDIDALFE